MEKQELSYSDYKAFRGYMEKALYGIIKLDYKDVYENLDSARDMATNWWYDGELDSCDNEFFTQHINQAVACWCLHDTFALLAEIICIRDGFSKMIERCTIIRDN